MNCYYHKDKDRAAECINCGKPLCRACSAYWGANMCTDCIKSIAAKKRNIFVLRLLAAVLLTSALFYLFYCKMGGAAPINALTAFLGGSESRRKTAFFIYALACIPVGLRAALTLGRWFAGVYDLKGRAISLCFIAVIIGGILLGAAAVPIYCIWLLYSVIKYNVTVKTAKTRLAKLSGRHIKRKRKK